MQLLYVKSEQHPAFPSEFLLCYTHRGFLFEAGEISILYDHLYGVLFSVFSGELHTLFIQ